MRLKHVALAIVLFALPCTAAADSWQRAIVTEVFSESRDHFVRITPGDNWREVMGFIECCPPGRNARAEFYQRQADGSYHPTASVELVNPVAPVVSLVSNDGRMVTIDNWHNRGYGHVIALYSGDGALIRSYQLSDLFSVEEIEAFAHSASSIHWQIGIPYFRRERDVMMRLPAEDEGHEQRDVLIHVAPEGSGASLMIGLQTGAFQYCEQRGGEYQCRNTNEGRVWRRWSEASQPR